LKASDSRGMSASWPGHHPALGKETKLAITPTGSTLQTLAAERGGSICCIPEGTACQGAPWSGRHSTPGAAATIDTVANRLPGARGEQEPSSPPALACFTKREDRCSSGEQADAQSPESSSKSGGNDRSGASMGAQSASAPLSVVSRSFKETHAERNRQAQQRYRQRQRVWPVRTLV